MKTFTLKNPTQLGDKDPKYGQAYWSFTHDQELPVMFNLMEGDVGDGSVITAETVELKESKKGTEYHRLKKVNVQSQGSITNAQPSQLDRIEAKLDQLLQGSDKSGYEKAKEVRAALPVTDSIAEVDPDEEIDLSDIPF
jgi:hypothetical protein